MNSFMGIEIGKRSVLVHQSALQITGHNIANANTPGYTRQTPNIVTTRPWHAPALTSDGSPGQMGTGVKIETINRIRDAFVDSQIRNENKTAGYWNSVKSGLDKIEVILNEPSKDGLRSVMDQFWQSWQELSAHPESEAARSVVAQRGMALADVFQHTYRQLIELREDVNANVKICVDQINSTALQLRDLNQQILAITIAGKQPNDLLDKRDLLLDQLSQIADTKINIDSKNMVTVQLGDRTLVAGVSYNQLTTQTDQNGMDMVVWADTKVKARIDNGQLRGLLDLRGRTELSQDRLPSEYTETIPNLIDQLNTLAKTIVIKTNELHQQGYSLNNKTSQPDGIDFFQMPAAPADNFMDWAKTMTVTSLIINDTKNIAAATAPTWNADGTKSNFGDGSNALAIARLKHSLNSDPMLVQDVTMDDYWRSLTAKVGVQSQEATRMVDNQRTLISQLENKRQSLSGVSLDEEMTNMIKYQQAYNAAARLITTVDEALDVLINRLGIVGR